MSSSTTQPQQAEFDDALHRLVHSTGRPKEKEQQEALKELLDNLVELCSDDIQRWKMFVLALTQKRYHSLSPAAKEQQLGEKSDKQQQQQVHGDGERLFFYVAMEHLIQRSLGESDSSMDATSTVPLIDRAIQAMTELAPLAGGSRDLCHLLVALVGFRLSQNDRLTSWKNDQVALRGKVSLSGLVAQGLCMFQEQANNIKITEKDKLVLKKILRSVAGMLDRDLDIVRGALKGEEESQTNNTSLLPSTIHVFIPHHERGRKRKGKRKESARNRGEQDSQTQKKTEEPSDRQVVNSIVEILLWSQTGHAQRYPAFAGAHERLLRAAAARDWEMAKQQLFTMQTIIRRLRQELNSYARDKGHLLSDQFALDANKLSSRQINAGKVGDLSKLTRLAGKKGNTRVVRLIALRNESNPSKITKFESISAILDNISRLKTNGSGDEIMQLEREICLKRLQATIKYLRDIAKKHTNSQDRPVAVVSMEDSKSDHVAAALVASAFSSWILPDFDKKEKQGTTTDSEMAEAKEQPVKLFLSGRECIPGDFEDLLSLLAAVDDGLMKTNSIPTFMDGGSATTKALLNFMDRNLPDSAMMVLITKGDVRIPSDYMSSLIARGCSLHVHNVDDLGARLKREGARKGDLTVSLAWDTVDDLDLHVFVPSGEELDFQNTASKDGLCFLDVDMNASVPYSKEPVENVFAGDEDAMIEAPHGHYKVVIQNYAYHEGGPMSEHPVPFRVVVNKNGTKETFRGACTKTGKESNITVCEFDYNGRTVPFPKQEEEKSAFGASNMVNLTASIGRTIDSLGQLVHVAYQQAHLDTVRTLANDNDAEHATLEAGTGEVIASEDVEMQGERRVVSGTLEVTSRDRLNMTLAHLPAKFHSIVGQAFDGENASKSPSLVELCATDLAQRMVAERIPIRQLRTLGYPDDIIDAVKEKMRVVGA